jgi:hypothetical protein
VPGHSPDEHAITFCPTDGAVADAAATYLLGSIRRGGAGMAVVTPAHARQIDERIAAAGVDPLWARAAGSYVVLDAPAAIEQFLVGGWPDPAAFWRTISPVIGHVMSAQRPLRVFGEMVSLLCAAGPIDVAIEVEALWNELARQRSFSLRCAYRRADAARPDADDELALVLAAHTSLVGPR